MLFVASAATTVHAQEAQPQDEQPWAEQPAQTDVLADDEEVEGVPGPPGAERLGASGEDDEAQTEPLPEPSPVAEPSGVRLRFSSVRLYRGGELQMAPAGTDAFDAVCELPCLTRAEPGAYNLNVALEDGRNYALPTTLRFDADTDISLKYGASTGAWAGAITALTGILGILITGGIAIAGAAGDDSGLVRGGLIGLGISSAVFGGGLITFLLSERGLRAEISAGE